MLFIEELYVFFYFSFYAFFARYVKVSKQFRFQLEPLSVSILVRKNI